MSQYALNLALPPVYAEDNFFVSSCNREAHRMVSAWPDWPSHALLMHGPKGSGKSHLAHIWASRAGAAAVSRPQGGEGGNLLVEDIEWLDDEQALLHVLNGSAENGRNLLLTSSVPASQLPFSLPDLTSRLKALPSVAIHEADDEALHRVLRKQFADRQIKINDDVIIYLTPRMERSFKKINILVDTLDRAALMEGRTITIPFVRRLLESASA